MGKWPASTLPPRKRRLGINGPSKPVVEDLEHIRKAKADKLHVVLEDICKTRDKNTPSVKPVLRSSVVSQSSADPPINNPASTICSLIPFSKKKCAVKVDKGTDSKSNLSLNIAQPTTGRSPRASKSKCLAFLKDVTGNISDPHHVQGMPKQKSVKQIVLKTQASDKSARKKSDIPYSPLNRESIKLVKERILSNSDKRPLVEKVDQVRLEKADKKADMSDSFRKYKLTKCEHSKIVASNEGMSKVEGGSEEDMVREGVDDSITISYSDMDAEIEVEEDQIFQFPMPEEEEEKSKAKSYAEEISEGKRKEEQNKPESEDIKVDHCLIEEFDYSKQIKMIPTKKRGRPRKTKFIGKRQVTQGSVAEKDSTHESASLIERKGGRKNPVKQKKTRHILLDKYKGPRPTRSVKNIMSTGSKSSNSKGRKPVETTVEKVPCEKRNVRIVSGSEMIFDNAIVGNKALSNTYDKPPPPYKPTNKQESKLECNQGEEQTYNLYKGTASIAQEKIVDNLLYDAADSEEETIEKDMARLEGETVANDTADSEDETVVKDTVESEETVVEHTIEPEGETIVKDGKAEREPKVKDTADTEGEIIIRITAEAVGETIVKDTVEAEEEAYVIDTVKTEKMMKDTSKPEVKKDTVMKGSSMTEETVVNDTEEIMVNSTEYAAKEAEKIVSSSKSGTESSKTEEVLPKEQGKMCNKDMASIEEKTEIVCEDPHAQVSSAIGDADEKIGKLEPSLVRCTYERKSREKVVKKLILSPKKKVEEQRESDKVKDMMCMPAPSFSPRAISPKFMYSSRGSPSLRSAGACSPWLTHHNGGLFSSMDSDGGTSTEYDHPHNFQVAKRRCSDSESSELEEIRTYSSSRKWTVGQHGKTYMRTFRPGENLDRNPKVEEIFKKKCAEIARLHEEEEDDEQMEEEAEEAKQKIIREAFQRAEKEKKIVGEKKLATMIELDDNECRKKRFTKKRPISPEKILQKTSTTESSPNKRSKSPKKRQPYLPLKSKQCSADKRTLSPVKKAQQQELSERSNDSDADVVVHIPAAVQQTQASRLHRQTYETESDHASTVVHIPQAVQQKVPQSPCQELSPIVSQHPCLPQSFSQSLWRPHPHQQKVNMIEGNIISSLEDTESSHSPSKSCQQAKRLDIRSAKFCGFECAGKKICEQAGKDEDVPLFSVRAVAVTPEKVKRLRRSYQKKFRKTSTRLEKYRQLAKGRIVHSKNSMTFKLDEDNEENMAGELLENAARVIVLPQTNVLHEGEIVTELNLVPKTVDDLEGGVILASGPETNSDQHLQQNVKEEQYRSIIEDPEKELVQEANQEHKAIGDPVEDAEQDNYSGVVDTSASIPAVVTKGKSGVKMLVPLTKPTLKGSISALGAKILRPAPDRPVLIRPPVDTSDSSSGESDTDAHIGATQSQHSFCNYSHLSSANGNKIEQATDHSKETTLRRRPCTHAQPPYKGIKVPYYNEKSLFWFDCERTVSYINGTSTGNRPPSHKTRVQVNTNMTFSSNSRCMCQVFKYEFSIPSESKQNLL